ncbi:MAG: DUF935 family protein [Magnetococcales bacterium]|nr:DUF935 family protein [Magnetococcales bacterium]
MIKQKWLLENLAGMANDPNRWTELMGILPNPDRVLEKSGHTWAIYRDVEMDAHVSSVVSTRQLLVQSKEWRLVQPDSSATAIKARDFVAEVLEGLDMGRIISDMHRAVFWGFAASEILWQPDGKQWGVEQVIDRPHRRFAFDGEGKLKLFTREHPVEGVLVPSGKFILTRNQPTYDNPYGKALFSVIFWSYFFKHASQTFWAQFLEKYGTPFLIGKYDTKAKQPEIDQLLANLQAAIRDAAVAIRADQSAEIAKIDSKNGGEAFKSKAEFCNGEISKAILGQNLTTEVKGEASHAAAKTHLDILKMLVGADGKMIAGALCRDLIGPMVRLNFGEEVTPPRFEFFEEDQPNEAWLSAFKEIKDLGVELPVSRSMVYERLNLPIPANGEDVIILGSSGKSALKESADFSELSESHPQTAVDGLVDQLLPEAQTAMAENEEMIISAIENSDSYEEAMEKLLALYPDLKSEPVQELLERGLVNGALFGAAAVTGEINNG